MAHACAASLDKLEPLLDSIRRYSPPLKEKKRGIFYLKSAAFLHFHDQDQRIVADLKIAGQWERFEANSKEEWTVLLNKIESLLGQKV